MTDPLADIVTLLKPTAPSSKLVSGAGAWRVRRTESGKPFYCAIIKGNCFLTIGGGQPIAVGQGDFILIPAAQEFQMSSATPLAPESLDTHPVLMPEAEFRLGSVESEAEVQLLVGYCVFDSPDAALLVSLLPRLVHIRGETRLALLVQLVRDEYRGQRPAKKMVLERLLEVLLIEAVRCAGMEPASGGLVAGLADERLSVAIRAMHRSPDRPWTMRELAREAGLSRSAFFARFSKAVGVPPMEYLLAWRMALAKDLLRRNKARILEVAERVGYGSAAAFSVAFSRYVGTPPARFSHQTEVNQAG